MSQASLRLRIASRVAAGLAFASAAITLYWTCGGTWLLETVGGSFERLARERGETALLLGSAVVLLKVAAGVCALALLVPVGSMRRVILGANAAAVVVLGVWGGANVVAGALVLTGVLETPDADRHALVWHVFFWDAWFLVWGLVLAVAVVIAARERGRRNDLPG